MHCECERRCGDAQGAAHGVDVQEAERSAELQRQEEHDGVVQGPRAVAGVVRRGGRTHVRLQLPQRTVLPQACISLVLQSCHTYEKNKNRYWVVKEFPLLA